MVMMYDQRLKKTKKEFKDYNIYHDRGLMKWGTAYAMDELVKGIKSNELEALKDNQPLKQMTREEIDCVLSESFLYLKVVEVQLNLKDKFGRLLDSIEGTFKGEAYDDFFVLNEDIKINWDDVRNVSIKNDKKWFDIDIFNDYTKKKLGIRIDVKKPPEIEYIKDETFQEFYEED